MAHSREFVLQVVTSFPMQHLPQRSVTAAKAGSANARRDVAKKIRPVLHSSSPR